MGADTVLDPNSVIETFSERLRLFVDLLEQGLNSDRSSLDAALRWVTGPAPTPTNPADASLMLSGILHQPVAVGVLTTSVFLAVGITLSACQELRAAYEKGYMDEVGAMGWVYAAAVVLQSERVELQRGKRFFAAGIVLSGGSVVLGLVQYYFVVVSPGMRYAVRGLSVALFATPFLVALVTILLLPFVGGPTAYLYTLYRAGRTIK
jgi:hypothetical protein